MSSVDWATTTRDAFQKYGEKAEEAYYCLGAVYMNGRPDSFDCTVGRVLT